MYSSAANIDDDIDNTPMPPPTRPVDPREAPGKAKSRKRIVDNLSPSPDGPDPDQKPSPDQHDQPPLSDSECEDDDILINIIGSLGLRAKVSDPLQILNNNSPLQCYSSKYYEKCKSMKVILHGPMDVVDYFKKRHPEIIKEIAEAPDLPARSGIPVLADNLANLYSNFGISARCSMELQLYIMMSDKRCGKKNMLSSFFELYLRTHDSHICSLLEQCCEGFKPHTMSKYWRYRYTDCLLSSPGAARISPTSSGFKQSLTDLQTLYQVFISVACYSEFDIDDLYNRIESTLSPTAKEHKTLARKSDEELLEACSRWKTAWEKLERECLVNQQLSLMPHQLRMIDSFASAMINEDIADMETVNKFIASEMNGRKGFKRSEITVDIVTEAIEACEKRALAAGIQCQLTTENLKSSSSTGRKKGNGSTDSSDHSDEADDHKEHDYREKRKLRRDAIRQLGGLVFTGQHVCSHCGEGPTEDDDYPHTLEDCMAINKCLNCGKTGHSTSNCPQPDEEVIQKNKRGKPDLPLNPVCAPALSDPDPEISSKGADAEGGNSVIGTPVLIGAAKVVLPADPDRELPSSIAAATIATTDSDTDDDPYADDICSSLYV